MTITDTELDIIRRTISDTVVTALDKHEDAIIIQVANLCGEIKKNNEKLLDLSGAVHEHELKIRGNGKPGLLANVEYMLPRVEDAYLALFGNVDKVGILSRVKTLEDANTNVNRLLWSAIGAITTFLVTVLLTNIIK